MPLIVQKIPFDDWKSTSEFAEWLVDELDCGNVRLPVEVTGFNPRAALYLYRALRRRNRQIGITRAEGSVFLRDLSAK